MVGVLSRDNEVGMLTIWHCMVEEFLDIGTREDAGFGCFRTLSYQHIDMLQVIQKLWDSKLVILSNSLDVISLYINSRRIGNVQAFIC